MTRLRIRTPSRLHFGLFGWGPHARRQFGGVGLMVDDPGLEILVEPSDGWDATGPLADRVRAVMSDVSARLQEAGHAVPSVRITTVRAPEAHVGLGVGTQLSLAVARGLTEMAGLADTPVETLARLTGRGRRSGIGVHGFGEGGLIVDGGRRDHQDVPTRLVRSTLPRDWSVLIVIPERSIGLSGSEEVQAFDTLPPLSGASTDRICRLVLLGLLPSLVESDLDEFGRALMEIQDVVGSAFAPVQGGRFADPRTEALVTGMKSLGLTGIGQSSWGPTLYAFTDRGDAARTAMRETLMREFQLPSERVFWTRANESGASTTSESA